jgi:hypothetical protein
LFVERCDFAGHGIALRECASAAGVFCEHRVSHFERHAASIAVAQYAAFVVSVALINFVASRI